MKGNDFENVSLSSLGKGAAVELFETELKKVIKNIVDPNIPAQVAREITLKVKFVPTEDRQNCAVKIQCTSSLANPKPFGSFVFVAEHKGQAVMLQDRFQQQDMFDDENIVDMADSNDESVAG